MAKDIRIRAILDDQVTKNLGRLQQSLNSIKTGTQTVSAAIKKTADQTDKVLGKAGSVNDPSGMYQKATLATKKFTQANTSLVSSLKAVPVAFTAVSGAIALLLKGLERITDRYDNIVTDSQKIGVSVTEFQKLEYAAMRSNTSIESITLSMKALSEQAVQAVTGNKQSKGMFDFLGIDVTDKGQLKEPMRLFDEVTEKLGSMTSETARSAIGTKMLGRGYQDLIPLLRGGKDGLNALKEEAVELGFVLSEGMVARLDEVHSSFEKLGAVWTATQAQFAVSTAGFTERWTAGLTDWIPKFGKALSTAIKVWETFCQGLYAAWLAVYGPISLAIMQIPVMINNIATTVLRVLLEPLQKFGGLISAEFGAAIQNWQDKLKGFATGGNDIMKGMTENWQLMMKEQGFKIQEIWADTTEGIVKDTKKPADGLDELRRLMKALGDESKKVKIKDLDPKQYNTAITILTRLIDAEKLEISVMEQRLSIIDETITAQERLGQIAADFAAADYSFAGRRIELAAAESKQLAQLSDDYAKGLIDYQQFQQAKTQTAYTYQREQDKVSLEAFTDAAGYATDLFQSVSGLMNQISEEQIKEIDKWENREARRIENSLLAEEYKEAELEKLMQKAEAKRKKEFQEQQALQLALAAINTAAGFIQELGKEGVYGIITGAAVLAAGAAEMATIAATSYATGGIVPGESRAGDKVPARVNSGEMILNQQQQARLFDMANGNGGGGNITISSPITISGNADAGTVTQMRSMHERHLESVRSAIMELQYRGRLKAA